MIKKLAIVGSLTVSSLCFASAEGDKRGSPGPDCNPKNWHEMTDKYEQLIREYEYVVNSDSLTEDEKIDRSIEISEEMRTLDDCEFLNKDYNDCMKESNAQQRSDYDRCERNGNSDSCYDRADKNNDDRRAACERVSHADNIADTVRDSSGSSKKSSHMNPADRR